MAAPKANATPEETFSPQLVTAHMPAWTAGELSDALGFSCLHTLVINCTLLPRELRPKLWQMTGLVFRAVLFLSIGILATYDAVPRRIKTWQETFNARQTVMHK